MNKVSKRITVIFLSLVMIFTMSGFGAVNAKADEITVPRIPISENITSVNKPSISVKTTGNSITLSIKKNADTEGYYVYVKKKGEAKYSLLSVIDQDGSKKRKYTVNGLENGTYYIRVKAFNGDLVSAYSKTRKCIIDNYLSAWNDDALAKQSIISYMKSITDENSLDYIPVKNRIAVFDLDGTLYCETDPNYFDHLLLAHRVLEDENYRDKASDFEKKVANDVLVMNETSKQAENMEVNHGTAVATSFKGFTPDEFYDYIAEYKKTPMNSYENMTLGEAFYVPMLQIVEYLEANDFTVYVVSGTDRFIVRGLLKDSALNIPFNHIIGSDETLVAPDQGDIDGLNYVYDDNDKLVFGGEFIVKNLKMNKVTVIAQEIGVQPVLSFGNSTGDSSMAEYVTTDNQYKSLAFMLCCDDTERENGNQAKADKMYGLCEEFDWIPVSMKNDWKTIYQEGVIKK